MEPSSDPVPPGLPAVLRGSCRCGRYIYTSTTPPISITFCHCVECRKASGSPFLSFGLFHNTALQFCGALPGAEAPIKVEPSHISIYGTPIAVRASCNNCGSPLFMRYHCRPDGTSVVMGIIDEASVVGSMPQPKEHIFLREKAKLFSVDRDDGLARHDGFNEPFQNRFSEWVSLGCPRRADVPEGGSEPGQKTVDVGETNEIYPLL